MEVDIVEGQEEDKLTVDNTPTPDVLSKYRLAGNFCSIAIKSVLSQCVPGANCAELCRIGDVAILSQTTSVYQEYERGISDPTSINVNNCVRSYSPLGDEESYVLDEGDIVTVSLGVHIDGYSVLSSQTVHVQATPSPAVGPVADAVCALHFATKGIINALSFGNSLQSHELLSEALDTFGVSVVDGSCLRRIRRFLIGQPTIEELGSKVLDFTNPVDEFSILPSEIYLLDLAISTGTGKTKAHSDLKPTIYTRSIPASKDHANFKLAATRSLFTQLTSTHSLYSVFPFTLRHHPDISRARLGIAELVTHGILYPSPVVVEKANKAIVVRRTVTVYVRKEGDIVILGGGEQESPVMWVRSEKSIRGDGQLESALKGEGTKVVELKRKGERMEMES